MKSIYLYISILFLFSLNACKKEYPALPYTDILAFSVKDANGEPLKAVIENNEIILSWPVGQTVPQEIVPSIIVADKATISPAAGTKVSLNESVVYTVTAEDGTVSTYKLKPVVNSFIPMIRAFHGVRLYKSKSFVTTTSDVQLGGDLFDDEEGKTQAFFVNANGQDIPVKINNITPISVTLDPNVVIGNYLGVKLISGNKKSFFSQTFEVIADPKPMILSTAVTTALTVKRAAQFTVTGGMNLNKINAVSLYNGTTDMFIAVKLKAVTATSIILEIPADFPLGDYLGISYAYPDSDYYAAGEDNLFFVDFPITVVK